MARSKRSRNRESPRQSKIPRARHRVNPGERVFRWDFSNVDKDGTWGIDKIKCSMFLNVIWGKIREYEGKKWNEVLADNHRVHRIPVGSIIPAAQKRLQDLKCDECSDHLLSFRLSGTERVWAIQYQDRPCFLWWDPNHEIYPVEKRHT